MTLIAHATEWVGIPGWVGYPVLQSGEFWEVRPSAIHGGGLFARRTIPRGTRIIEYLGERITKAESLRRAQAQIERARGGGDGAVYIFELNRRYDLDGNVAWNAARLINHSCAPNCASEQLPGHIWIRARRRIEAGEELTYNYGYAAEHHAEHPCRCGAPTCVGAIVARSQWRKLAGLRSAAGVSPVG